MGVGPLISYLEGFRYGRLRIGFQGLEFTVLCKGYCKGGSLVLYGLL